MEYWSTGMLENAGDGSTGFQHANTPSRQYAITPIRHHASLFLFKEIWKNHC
jgi:hypothetical protein